MKPRNALLLVALVAGSFTTLTAWYTQNPFETWSSMTGPGVLIPLLGALAGNVMAQMPAWVERFTEGKRRSGDTPAVDGREHRRVRLRRSTDGA